MANSRAESQSDRDDLAGFGLEDEDGGWLGHVRSVVSPDPLGCIGAYEIIREVARGGQGVVYEARRTGSKKRIAIKRLIAGSLATDTMRRRFDRELSATASLDHPNIVTVFGMDTVDGEPLLAMEWVDGVPITQWATDSTDTLRPVPEILDLFVTLCDAVQHAHRNGVIHRDFKPSNILVGKDHEPHILDFGLAKLSWAEESWQASLTATAQFVGTIACAAPEQLSDVHHSADLRVDIYALGLLLYEMLTGESPYPRDGALSEILDHIRHTEPVRPSTFGPRCDQELETVVLKALAKKPEERYQSVEALAADLRRYRLGEPVSALPPSSVDLLRKFYHRHRTASLIGGISLVAIVGLALLAGLFGLLALRARQNETRARRVAEHSGAFLQGMLADANRLQHGKDVTLMAVLDDAVGRVDAVLGDEPEAAADVYRTIAETYYSLWLTTRSVQYWRSALALYRQTLGDEHEKVAACLGALGAVLSFQDSPEAIDLQSEALRIRRKLFGENDMRTARSIHALGFALYRGSTPPAFDDAERNFRDALQRKRALLPAPHASIALTLHTYAAMLSRQGRHDESLRRFEESLAMKNAIAGSDSVDMSEFLSDYGMAFRRAGRDRAALVMLRRAVEMKERHVGKAWTAAPLYRMAGAHQSLGEMQEARRLYCESLRRYFGLSATYPDRLPSALRRVIQTDTDLTDEAALDALQVVLIDLLPEVAIDAHFSTFVYTDILTGLAQLLVELGEIAAAVTVGTEAFRVRELTLPSGHWQLAESHAVLGYALARRGDPQLGDAMLTEAATVLTENRGPQSLEAMVAQRYLADRRRKAIWSTGP